MENFLDLNTDASLLADMRQDGLSDTQARETLEAFNGRIFTHKEWDKVYDMAHGAVERRSYAVEGGNYFNTVEHF